MGQIAEFKLRRKPAPKANPTAEKLNWLKAIRFDRRVSNFDYRVAACIAEHFNPNTGLAYVSDDIVAIETGRRDRGAVLRARIRLRKYGYLHWTRTRDANLYRPNRDTVAERLAMLKALKQGLRNVPVATLGNVPDATADVVPATHNTVSDSVKTQKRRSHQGDTDSDERKLPLMRVVTGGG